MSATKSLAERLGGKFKGHQTFPEAVRFSKASSEEVTVFELVQQQQQQAAVISDPIDTPAKPEESSNSASSSVGSCEQSTPGDHSISSLREPSPLKEAILTKFARLAPNSSSPNAGVVGVGVGHGVGHGVGLTSLAAASQHQQQQSQSLSGSPKESESSLLSMSFPDQCQVRGRIARTVEEKYTEYKHEREQRRQQQQQQQQQQQLQSSLDLTDSDAEEKLSSSEVQLSHSVSEGGNLDKRAYGSASLILPHEEERNEEEFSVKSLPLIANFDEADSRTPVFRSLAFDGSPQEEKTPVVKGEGRSPTRERRRFTFSFLDKSKAATATPTPGETKELEGSRINETNSKTGTPTKSSLRTRMLGLMGKTPQNNEVPGSPTASEDPFAETTTELNTPNQEFPCDQVEEAMEADERLVFDPTEDDDEDEFCMGEDRKDGEDETEETLTSTYYWWTAALPICIISFIQLLPLPTWFVGFLTGSLLSGALVGVAVWAFYAPTSGNKFVENLPKRVPKRKAIIIQEELERKYTWMNMWPCKNGPYDPLTYDVRRTMSVRLMLHGPWVELRFPRRNLPLRRMHDDIEPENVAFLEHKELLDLTNCAIELVPENLPSKRVWSKKYPIRVRTHARKHQEEDSRVPANPESVPDPVAAKDEEQHQQQNLESVRLSDLLQQPARTEIWKSVGHSEPVEATTKEAPEEEKEEVIGESEEKCNQPSDEDKTEKRSEEKNLDDFEVLGEESKTFYLFARTSREKEEWFNRLTVGSKFTQDWNQQTNPHYETFKEKEQNFRMFMENYFQARHAEAARKVQLMTRGDEDKRQIAREQVAFLNIFGARLWHDLHNSKGFVDLLREKITRKLLKVKIAQYFEEVSVTTLDLGQRLPQILSTSLPWQDDLGLWADLEIEYDGICQATVETQGIRLPGKDEPDREAQELASRQAATVDSDEEDSAEEDDDLPDNQENLDFAGGPTGVEAQVHGSGFRVRMLEGLLKSEFVAKVAESEWVKKNITSRNITLQLQLHVVKGTLTVNLPPAPSDRIWYGFRRPPQLELALRPCFGGRSLGKYESTLAAVMRQLEKRLKQEFMKVLVYPNMDDEVLPFLQHVNYSVTQ